MIGGVTRHMLLHLSGVPHLHVNRPLELVSILRWVVLINNDLLNQKQFGETKVTVFFIL